jgi:hypothetical protein
VTQTGTAAYADAFRNVARHLAGRISVETLSS